MDYKLVISEHADESLDNLVYYLLYRLKSEQADETAKLAKMNE